MNRILTAILTITLSSATIFSADAQRRWSRENRMNNPRVSAMNENTQKEWAELQKKLAEKDPKGFEEVKKLAQTNLPAAFNKMQILMQKANLKAPSRFSSGRNMNRREGMQGMRGMRNGEGMRGGRAFGNGRGMNSFNPAQKRTEAEAKIAEKFPTEYSAYKKAVESNREKIRTLAGKTGIKLPANAEEMAFVSEKYKNELEGLQWRERFAKLREFMEKEGYEMSFGGFRGGMNMTPPKPAPPAKRDFSRNDLARKAKQQYPEEWQEYMELNRKDKKAAGIKLEALLRKVK